MISFLFSILPHESLGMRLSYTMLLPLLFALLKYCTFISLSPLPTPLTLSSPSPLPHPLPFPLHPLSSSSLPPPHTHTHSTVVFAPIIGGVAGSTVIPLVLATILAYCITGYIRDELYHPFVKGCVGAAGNILVGSQPSVSSIVRVSEIISHINAITIVSMQSVSHGQCIRSCLATSG